MVTDEEVLDAVTVLADAIKGMPVKQVEAVLVIVRHFNHQALRRSREVAGLGYLNREEDVVQRLKDSGL